MNVLVPKDLSLRNSIRVALGMPILRPRMVKIIDTIRVGQIMGEISQIKGHFDDDKLIDTYSHELDEAAEAFNNLKDMKIIQSIRPGVYIIKDII